MHESYIIIKLSNHKLSAINRVERVFKVKNLLECLADWCVKQIQEKCVDAIFNIFLTCQHNFTF